MRYGRYIGRVGALAVALGIGTAVAAPVWASPEGTADSPAASEASPAPATPETADPAVSSDVKPSVQETTTPTSSKPKPKPKPKKRTAKEASTNTAGAESPKPTSKTAVQSTTGDSSEPNTAAKTASAPVPQVAVAATEQPARTAPSPALAAAQPAAAKPASLAAALTRPVLAILNALRDGLAGSPLGWVLVGAARRQVGTTEDPAADIPAQRVAATQTVAAAVTNAPPTASVTWGRPDATTGTVLGQLTTSDPEGKKVTVTLTGRPSTGTVAYNTTTKVITYTPTTAQRFLASATPTDDSIAMTFTLSDGVNKVAAPIDIPVSPSPFYTAADIPSVSDPRAVAASNTRAYVANHDAGTVTVYDTVKGTVVGTYQVGSAPDGVAVKRDGTRLYVSSSTNNKVTVIDTATGVTKATVAVTNPTAIAINPSGSTVYVANGNTATVTKISTSTNKTSGTVKLAAGVTPTELAVSADGKNIYVAGAKATGGGTIAVFSSSASTATTITDIAGTPTGLAISATYSQLYASATDGAITVVNTASRTAGTLNIGTPLSGIAITNDSSALMVTTNSGLLASLSTVNGGIVGVMTLRDTATPTQPGVVLSPDGLQMFVTDRDLDTVHVVSLVPPNKAPFSSDPFATVSATGVVSGRVGVVDFDADPLTYTILAKPTKGTLVLKADGTYTYTPTSTARHIAATGSATTDSVTIAVSDGRNGTVTTTIPLTITPANKVPTVSATIGNPASSTGIVKGSLKITDGDNDKRTLTVTGLPGKGTVAVTTSGAFTYTPTAAARTAALAPGATHADRQDTFTVTVDDGHGGVVPVTVNVKLGAANIKPTGAKATVTSSNTRTGVIGGAIVAADADGDTLTYTAGKTTKGTVVVNADGTFTYTPTAAARLAASAPRASSATKSETITITVADGFGGTTTTSVKVAVAPNPTANNAPANGHATVDITSDAIGTVTGSVSADDDDDDTLTYSLAAGPAFGTAKVTSTGQFTYTPDLDSRYRALATPFVDTDSFTVQISDGFGGTTTATVEVTIAPPSATAIDQRATTVAVNAQQMYFYSQTDTDTALGLLKAAGVDTIRIMLPWAGVESEDDTFDWSAIDRMVDGAALNGIKVLATINATPDWAAVPDQPAYIGAPADLAAFGDFVTEVAARYQGRIADYEIWNEPNADFFWSPKPDAAQYTALLKVAYTSIKAVDPDAVVIGASVAAVFETPGGPAINPVTYLTQMYAAGAAGYFDALSYHPYLYSMPFSAGEGHAGMPLTMAEQMYAVMVANGDGNKKIWATEYGEPTSDVSETVQAAYIGDFLRTWRTLEFAGPAFIHTFADYSSGDPVQDTFGIFRADWTPKPAVAVVTQVIAENEAINNAVV